MLSLRLVGSSWRRRWWWKRLHRLSSPTWLPSHDALLLELGIWIFGSTILCIRRWSRRRREHSPLCLSRWMSRWWRRQGRYMGVLCHRLRGRKWHILLSLGIHGDTDRMKLSQCDRDAFESLTKVYLTGYLVYLAFPFNLFRTIFCFCRCRESITTFSANRVQ